MLPKKITANLSKCLTSLLLLLLLTPAVLQAQTAVHSAIFLLTAEGSESCATAFALDQRTIVTNAHVVRALCPFGTCPRLNLLAATQIDEQPKKIFSSADIGIVSELRGLDLALLQLPTPLPMLMFPQLRSDTVAQGESVQLLGFPSCDRLRRSVGTLRTQDQWYFEIEAKGNYGSSGSPVFDSNNQLIGIVDQAAGLFSALSGRLSGAGFTLRAVSAVALRDFADRDALALINFQAQILLARYRAQVRTQSGLVRVVEGLRFLAQTYDLAAQATPLVIAHSQLLPLLYFDRPLSVVKLPQDTEYPVAFVGLLLAQAVESRGLRDERWNVLPVQTLRSSFAKNVKAEDQQQIFEIIDYASYDYHQGLYFSVAFYALTALGILLSFAAVWAFSLGWAFSRASGSRALRVLKVIAAGVVFWPFSLLLFRR